MKQNILIISCIQETKNSKIPIFRAVVVAQLVERLPLKPGNHSLNPVIGNTYYLSTDCIEKAKVKKQRPEMDQLLKIPTFFCSHQ